MASAFEVLAMAKSSFLDNTPTAFLFQNAAQSIPNSSSFTNVVLFQTESDDNWQGHSNVTNTSRYTAQVAGLYMINGQITYTNTTNLLVRALAIQKNGSLQLGTECYNQSYSNNFCSVNTSALIRLGVGDYVELNTWQNSTAALNTVAAGTAMTVAYIHA